MSTRQGQDFQSFGLDSFAIETFAVDAVESSAIDSCFYEQQIPVVALSSETTVSPEYVLNPHDRSILIDHHGRPVTVDKLLATKPLRHELLTRPGPGGRKLLYVSGESITRTLNDIFGFDGWQLEIRKVEKTVCNQEESKSQSNNSNNSTASKPLQWHVAYIAHVRITHVKSGTFKEDLGAGDAIDRHLPTAIAHAMKASITDALKRAARHFGDKLGNSLYSGTFNLQNAPKTLAEALDQYDKERAIFKFGNPPQTTTISKKKPPEEMKSALNTITNRSIPQSNSEKTTTNQSVPQSRSENSMKHPAEQLPFATANGKHSISKNEVFHNQSNQPSKPSPPSNPQQQQQHQHSMVSNMTNHFAANTPNSLPIVTKSSPQPIQPPPHRSAATIQSYGSVPLPSRVSLSDTSAVLPPATSVQGLNQLMAVTTQTTPFLEWSSSLRPETSFGRSTSITKQPDPKKQKVNPYFAASSL
jgi:recombination DNA repair RAD52 pathway protein